MHNTRDDLIAELRATIIERDDEIRALRRHIEELRGAIDVLLQPAASELLAKNLAHPSRQ